MKKQLTALVFAAVTLFSVGCAKTGHSVTKAEFEQSPVEVLARSYTAQEYIGEDISLGTIASDEIAQYNKVTVSLDLGTVSGGEVEGEATIALTADEKKSALRLDGEMTSEGKTVDASLYVDKSKLAVASDTLLGSKSYGIKFEGFDKFISKFGKSDLAKLLGVDEDDLRDAIDELGIDEDFVEDVTSEIEKYTESMKKSADKLSEEINEVVNKHSDGVKEEKIELGGRKYSAYTIEVDVDNAFVKDMLGVLTDYSFDILDGEVDMVRAISEPLANMIGMYAMEEFADEVEYSKRDIEDEMEDLFDDFGIDGTYVAIVNKADGKNLKTTFKGTVTDYYDEIEIDFESVSVGDPYFRLTMYSREENDTIEVRGSITKPADKSKDGMIIALTVSVPDEDEKEMRIEFIRDKKTDAFDLNVLIDDDELLNVKGKLNIEKKKTEIAIDSIEADGDMVKLGMKIILEKNAAVKELKGFTDILSMKEKDLENLANTVTKNVRKLAA